VQSQTQVAATLKISVRELWSLSSNPNFPRPIGNDANGDVVWADGDISAFVELWSAIKAHGWRITPSLLPTLDIRAMAAAAPGRHYVPRLVRMR
jgi:hypothetical protein